MSENVLNRYICTGRKSGDIENNIYNSLWLLFVPPSFHASPSLASNPFKLTVLCIHFSQQAKCEWLAQRRLALCRQPLQNQYEAGPTSAQPSICGFEEQGPGQPQAQYGYYRIQSRPGWLYKVKETFVSMEPSRRRAPPCWLGVTRSTFLLRVRLLGFQVIELVSVSDSASDHTQAVTQNTVVTQPVP